MPKAKQNLNYNLHKHIINIGIDVSTNKTGFASFINRKLTTYGEINTKSDLTFSGDKIAKDHHKINDIILGYFARTKQRLEELLPEDGLISGTDKLEITFNIVLESSNHGLASVGQKLSVYVGMYSGAVVGAITTLFVEPIINLKLVNPREWQLRAFGNVLDSKDGKIESINRALDIAERDFKGFELDPINDDIADAINIASLAESVRDNYLVGQAKTYRAKFQISSKNNILNAEIRLNKLSDILRSKQHKAILRIQTIKNQTALTQQRLEDEKKKQLIKYATAEQLASIHKAKQVLTDNKASLDIINKFRIIGEINDK